MLEMLEDLSGDTRVSRSRVTNHPEFSQPILMTQYGWKKGSKTVWDEEVKIEEIPCLT